MYTFAEIAAELALETPGIDALETATLCRGPRGRRRRHGGLDGLDLRAVPRRSSCYLWDKTAGRASGLRHVAPDQLRRTSCSRCSRCRGAAPRCRSISSAMRACAAASRCVGFYDNDAMQDGARAWPEVGSGVQAPARRAAGPRCIKAIVESTTPGHAAARAHDADAHGRHRNRPRPARRRPRHGARHHGRTSPPARCRRRP